MPDVYPADRAPLFTSTRAQDARLAASFDRLAQPDYAPAAVIAETVDDPWPGDLAGRLLLSLSRFARAGWPALPHAAELFEAMLQAVEGHGYFGPPLGDVVDEQQVACHGWVVSGMLQYSAVSGDARASVAAFRIVDTLLLPALARLESYPFDRDTSAVVGEASGSADVIANGWQLSTDIWCLFLSLNGLVPSYLESGRTEIAAAIVSLRRVLDRVDVVGKRAQLHATLAAARCLADFAEAGLAGADDSGVGADQFLAAQTTALRLYDSYAAHGRTLNYATFNWFGRPDSWTEPCAIVDSLALAYTLWRLTRDDRYLADAHRVEYNALDTAERPNGSFGLDSVLTPDHPELHALHPDARWCCTMRGALGLLEARENSVAYVALSGGGAEFELVGFHSGTIRAGGWTFRETTVYPAVGQVSFEVVRAPVAGAPLTLTLQFPEGGRITVVLPARPGALVEAVIPQAVAREAVGGGLVSVFRGPVLQSIHSATPRPPGELDPNVKLDIPPKGGQTEPA
ncbi:hypothetical protein B7R22_06890 [Subtercola boreus]|uniref:Uncharacterized protein n=1 Tax=Subtercola boreus TaxID=120213 RepID=A0A3E0VZL0_9MICO|nr:hypothetical protein [Subtercola boreus]RFA15544.1 hypothetical protein B7R22_06890 [Subtercola boreus]